MRRSKSKDPGALIWTANSDQVNESELQRVKVGKKSILLSRWEGAIIAIDAVCPHAAADLGKGSLSRYKLTCPDHKYCFDIRSGLILWPEDENYQLKRYETHEDNGSIYIRLE